MVARNSPHRDDEVHSRTRRRAAPQQLRQHQFDRRVDRLLVADAELGRSRRHSRRAACARPPARVASTYRHQRRRSHASRDNRPWRALPTRPRRSAESAPRLPFALCESAPSVGADARCSSRLVLVNSRDAVDDGIQSKQKRGARRTGRHGAVQMAWQASAFASVVIAMCPAVSGRIGRRLEAIEDHLELDSYPSLWSWRIPMTTAQSTAGWNRPQSPAPGSR
jgi:hypothetical protein